MIHYQYDKCIVGHGGQTQCKITKCPSTHDIEHCTWEGTTILLETNTWEEVMETVDERIP